MFSVYITGDFMDFGKLLLNITMQNKFIFSIIGLLLLSLFCGCDTPRTLNATAIHRTDLLVKKVFNSEKITRAEGTFIWGSEIEDTFTPKKEKYSAVGEKVSAAIAPIFKQDNVSGFLIESYYADSCHAVKFGKDKRITMDGPSNSRLVCVQIHFTPPGKVGRKSYILAIPVDTSVNPETLMISVATLNGELIIPQQSFDLKKGIR